MKTFTIAILATTIGFASAASESNKRQTDVNLADIQALIANINEYENVVADNADNLYSYVTLVEAYGGTAGSELPAYWTEYLQYMEISFGILQDMAALFGDA